MKIAVPVWEGRVSPVLDTADRLLLIDTRDGDIVSRTEISLGGKSLPEKAREIKQHADVLICAALSRPMESYLLSSGMEVYPWVMGDAEKLAEIYARGHIPGPEFSMPGCRKQYRRRGMHRKRYGKWDGSRRIEP